VFKKLHVWTSEAVKRQGQFLSYAHLGHWFNLAPAELQAQEMNSPWFFRKQSKTSILTAQTMQLLCSQGHLDCRFDMVTMGATLLDCCLLIHAMQRNSTSGFVA